MIITLVSCILILGLQGVILFYLLKLPLSLWFDASLTAGILSGIAICIQVLFSGSIYDLFFMVDFEELEAVENEKEKNDDEGKPEAENSSGKKMPNIEIQPGVEVLEKEEGKQASEEERSIFREETRGFVEGILTDMGVKCRVAMCGAPHSESRLQVAPTGGVKCRVIICGDPHPFILSYGGLTGGSRLVISTGLANILERPELAALVKREAFLLKDGGTKIFSIATFLPFVILSLSHWMIETAKELRKHRGTGASFLAGGILFHVYRISEFFLLFISRSRQASAVKSISSEDRECLAKALEKAVRGFCEPVKTGPPFRKLIYESMRYFFPFDPVRLRNVLLWEKFSGRETGILSFAEKLGKTNPFYRLNGIYSSHPEKISGYSADCPISRMPWSKNELSRDLLMLTLPWIITAAGAAVSFFIKGYFGIPLILLGLSLAILIIYFLRTEKKGTSEERENSRRLKISGTLGERYFGSNFEAPYYFIKHDDSYIPLILKQMGRDEEPLFLMTGEKAQAEGVIRTHEIPYLEVRSIKAEEGKAPGIVSLSLWYGALLALGIMALGALIIIVQIGS